VGCATGMPEERSPIWGSADEVRQSLVVRLEFSVEGFMFPSGIARRRAAFCALRIFPGCQRRVGRVLNTCDQQMLFL